MAGLSAKDTTQLIALLEKNGISTILGGITEWTARNPEKTRTNKEPKTARKGKTKLKKTQLLNQLKEEHPDWDLGKGKGLTLGALKIAVETGEKPVPKTSPYIKFQEVVRKDIGSHKLSPTQVMKIIGCRWRLLKTFAGVKGLSNIDIVNSKDMLEELAKTYNTIEEDMKTKKVKKAEKPKKKTGADSDTEGSANEKTKKTTKKKTKKKTEENPKKKKEDLPAAGMFASDSESDSESDSDIDSDIDESDK